MKDNEIDQLLEAARVSQSPEKGPDPEMLRHITASVQASLKLVRPLPSQWVLTASLLLLAVVIVVLGAARVGFLGIEEMASWQRMLIFPALIVFIYLAAGEFVSSLIPG